MFTSAGKKEVTLTLNQLLRVKREKQGKYEWFDRVTLSVHFQ